MTVTITASNVMVTCHLDIQWCLFDGDTNRATTDITCSTGDPRLSGQSTVEINTARGTVGMDFKFRSPNLNITPPCLPAGDIHADGVLMAAGSVAYEHRPFTNQSCAHKNGVLLSRGDGANGYGRQCRLDLGTFHEVAATGGGFTAGLLNTVANAGLPWNWGDG